jgi:hypothetical protein
MGREKRARLKRWSKNTRRTCRCSRHHEASYPRRSKSLQQTTDATYYYDKRIGMIMWSMYAWRGNYDAMQLIQIKRNSEFRHTHMIQVILLHGKFKCWLAWQRQSMGALHKIKWSGENIISISHILHMLLVGVIQITTSLHDARCKQVYRCHIQILCIFLINFHIKYFLFRVMDQKIWIYQDLHICRNFRKQRKKNCAGWNWSGPEATDSICRAPAMGNTGKKTGRGPASFGSEQKGCKKGGFY